MINRLISTAVIATSVFLSACTGMPAIDQKYDRIPPETPMVKVPAPMSVLSENRLVSEPVLEDSAPVTGSLYRPNYPVQIFSDRRAYRVGDILTIKIEDTATFTKDSNTSLDKGGQISLAAPNVFGQVRNGLEVDLKPIRKSSGGTKFSRNSSQSGQIAVQVVSVLPNGALRVQGEKWLQLNNEAEFVRVSGILRPEDITTNNEVSSNKLAQARVTYSGIGAQADVHEPGWATKTVNSPWFPF